MNFVDEILCPFEGMLSFCWLKGFFRWIPTKHAKHSENCIHLFFHRYILSPPFFCARCCAVYWSYNGGFDLCLYYISVPSPTCWNFSILVLFENRLAVSLCFMPFINLMNMLCLLQLVRLKMLFQSAKYRILR